ncbi:MAG: NTP transferase domain-containing protein [Candidatus Cloacimonetes bacterium]|nr:NTP transferase domain-containing protein [Candidatus Cloacimonadota bacterium]
MKAVIIAAGCGSRLKDKHKGIPKTLLTIQGKRIIDDIIEKLRISGISEIIIITGYKHQVLKSELSNYQNSVIKLSFVYNKDWKKANGISVLAARHALSINDQFILLMSDHIFSKEMLELIIETEIEKDEALLALDFKIDKIPDLDDGMKIQCKLIKDNIYLINRFGKQLNDFNAIDSGMFKLNFSFFEALEKSISEGNRSLSDACNILSEKGKMKGIDIGGCLWLDIDTPEMIEKKYIISNGGKLILLKTFI